MNTDVILQFTFTFISFLLIFLYWFPITIVHGDSMEPTYHDGQKLFSRRITRFDNLKSGEVYAFWSPEEPNKLLIKRLHEVFEKNYCYFLGDNSEVSFDSRYFGLVHRSKIVAKIIGG